MPIQEVEDSTIQLEDAIRCAIDGDAVLFLGAGLSFMSQRADGSHPPDGEGLIDLLLSQPSGMGSKHSLDRVAGQVARTKGVDFVYDTLKTSLNIKAVSQDFKTLCNLPWKRIYTTNYDNAIEIARSGAMPVSTVTIDELQSKAKIGSVIHINGSIKRISPANINDGLLLTDSSYATSRLVETGWLSFSSKT